MNTSIFTVWSYNINMAITGIVALLPDAVPASYNLVMADTGQVGHFYRCYSESHKASCSSANDVLIV